MASVTYDAVTIAQRNVNLVNKLDLHIEDKEFLVLLGPVGSGIVTALYCLAGFVKPTQGDVKIDKRKMNDVPIRDRNIAMVFQSNAFYPRMSVYDNLIFEFETRKSFTSEIDQYVKEIANLLDIGHLLDRKPKQLSAQQRLCVTLGRAIVRKPDVYLFEEPLSNLDAKWHVQTRALLTRLHQRLQTTFIYVTHDQVEAMTMASRIAVMKDGIFQQSDTPTNLYNRPHNVFVAEFIGRPSMNFFDAKLVEKEGELEINTGGFRLVVAEAKAREWRQYKNREVIFGIRPEDLYARNMATENILAGDMTAIVDLIEFRGNENWLYLITKDERQFLARVDPQVKTERGATLELAVNMDNAHIFDPKTEINLVSQD